MQEILDLENAMTSQRDKAILWFLESAPFRQGTLTKLLWRDLKPTAQLLMQIREDSKGQITRTNEEDVEIANEVPFYLEVEAERLKGCGKGKYKGIRQVGFLHSLAVEKLEKYKQELKKRNIAILDDSPIFVVLDHNPHVNKGDRLQCLTLVFYNASIMAWNDPEKRMFSPQDFRDVLQSALERVEVNPNLISPMLGHKVKGVDRHYSNHSIEEFLLIFRKALPWLIPQTVEEVKVETKARLAEEQKRLTTVEYENLTLKKEVVGVRRDHGKLEGEVREVWAMLQKLSDSQRKTIEAQMRKNEEEAEERSNKENAKRLSETTPEEEETIRANLKKLPQIIEEDKKRQKEEAEETKGLNRIIVECFQFFLIFFKDRLFFSYLKSLKPFWFKFALFLKE